MKPLGPRCGKPVWADTCGRPAGHPGSCVQAEVLRQYRDPEHRREGVRTHGYAGYSNGCRCGVCKTAKSEYQRNRRSAATQRAAASPWTVVQVPGITHGTRSTYEEHGCRCTPCKQTQATGTSRHPGRAA